MTFSDHSHPETLAMQSSSLRLRPLRLLPLAFSGLAFLVPWSRHRGTAWHGNAAAQSRLPRRALGDSEDQSREIWSYELQFVFVQIFPYSGSTFVLASFEELSTLQSWMLEQGAPSSASFGNSVHITAMARIDSRDSRDRYG